MTETDLKKIEITGAWSTRLNQELCDQVNEAIPDFIPTDPEIEINKASILIEFIKRALVRSASAKDFQKLQAENADYKRIQQENVTTIETKQNEYEKLLGEYQKLQELYVERGGIIEGHETRIKELETSLSGVESVAGQLTSQLENPRLIQIKLSEAEFEVTEEFRAKLSEFVKSPVSIAEMLFDLFWKYVIEQKTRIAFPFFLSKKRINEILNKHRDSE